MKYYDFTSVGILRLEFIYLFFVGWLTVTVPGEGLGLWEAHKKYGKLSWASLVDPAIQLATFGFRVDKNLALHLKKYNGTIQKDASPSSN